jgi:transmembrane sensor
MARLRTEAIMNDITAIDEVAARWHARAMTRELSPDEEQRLDAWLAEDARHRLAYADVAAAGYAFEQAAPTIAIPQRATRSWPIWTSAAFAPLLLLLAAIWMPHAWQDWRSDAHAAVGALRVERLADGSILQLNTDTAVALPFTPDRRDVELLRGELAVEVAKDPAHPFRVHCDGIEARAVGTHFVVARRTDEIEVGVTEGTVAVRAGEHAEPTLVQAGQRVLVDVRSHTIRSDALGSASYSWTRGVLSFEREPLSQVVAEIARYLPEHVVFRASDHASMPVTATFPLEHPEAALAVLANTHGLKLRHIPKLLYVVED